MGTEVTCSVIPVEWAEAINQNPACMVLRGALADWYREQGDDIAAEALDWSIAKNRSPRYGLTTAGYTWGGIIPDRLCNTKPDGWKGISDAHYALERLIGKWKNSTPEERQEYWQWNRINNSLTPNKKSQP
jgi:hypothetical protein